MKRMMKIEPSLMIELKSTPLCLLVPMSYSLLYRELEEESDDHALPEIPSPITKT